MERRAGFWPAVALTVIGHAAVLGYLGTRAPEPGLAGVTAPRAPVFQVRALGEVKESREEAAAQAAASVLAKREIPGPAPRTEPPAPISEAQPVPPAVEPPPASVAAVAPPAEPPYLKRGQLTVPPRLVTPLQVPFPEDVKGFVDLKVELTLFIDEAGVVQRVRVDSEVHPSFVRAVQESFGSARFTPGELERMPVRSQVRMEVEFHSPSRRRS